MTDKIPTMLSTQETSKRSGIPESRIRKWCKEGKIVFVTAGSKRLINWERFIQYLNTGDVIRG